MRVWLPLGLPLVPDLSPWICRGRLAALLHPNLGQQVQAEVLGGHHPGARSAHTDPCLCQALPLSPGTAEEVPADGLHAHSGDDHSGPSHRPVPNPGLFVLTGKVDKWTSRRLTSQKHTFLITWLEMTTVPCCLTRTSEQRGVLLYLSTQQQSKQGGSFFSAPVALAKKRCCWERTLRDEQPPARIRKVLGPHC